MNKTIQQRVAELSATLKPIKDYDNTSEITCDMQEEAEDYCSYNSSFYCDGWVKPIFEGDFKGVLLQKVEDFQVLRMYYICTRLEGLAYNEIPEDWNENDDIDIPQMEVTDVVEYRQIWFNRTEQETVNLEKLINEGYNDDAFVVNAIGVHDWAYEPKYKDFIIKKVNQHKSYYKDTFSLEWFFSPCAELLMRKAYDFHNCVVSLCRTDDAIKFYKSLKVAIRHDYELPHTKEMTRMLLDYYDLLSMTGNVGNMTNPKFICPDDIQQAHDRLSAKRDKLLEEQEIRKAKLKEAEFAEKHAWLLGISFDTEHFHFQSLDSVEAYRVEGKIMHHCIYRAKYYEKHDYLSMHITDHESNRVATCTIDLLNRRIEQIQPIGNATGYEHTFGAAWQDTNDYKHIWNTLMARMHTFPKRKPQQTEQQQIKVA